MIKITKASQKDLIQIKAEIERLGLDYEDLNPNQFMIAKNNDELIGFGRLKVHPDCIELCSLGVIKKYRNKGIGRTIVKRLLDNVQQAVYLVTKIPAYFSQLGFNHIISEDIPKSLISKTRLCKQLCKCSETFVIKIPPTN